jgi:hypothetical protein
MTGRMFLRGQTRSVSRRAACWGGTLRNNQRRACVIVKHLLDSESINNILDRMIMYLLMADTCSNEKESING